MSNRQAMQGGEELLLAQLSVALPGHRDPSVLLVASILRVASWPKMAAGSPEITSSCRLEERRR